jgi:uncharacterized membrane protein YsdA (DUF1294 family)
MFPNLTTLTDLPMRYASILLFAGLYAFAMVNWGTPRLVGAAYLAASAACFVVYAFDKAAARAGRWRTSENTLLLMGLACGWPGAVLAQQWLRHKSSKPSFHARFWVTVGLNTAAFAYLASPTSFIR